MVLINDDVNKKNICSFTTLVLESLVSKPHCKIFFEVMSDAHVCAAQQILKSKFCNKLYCIFSKF